MQKKNVLIIIIVIFSIIISFLLLKNMFFNNIVPKKDDIRILKSDYYSVIGNTDTYMDWPSYTNKTFDYTIKYPRKLHVAENNLNDSNIIFSDEYGMWVVEISVTSTQFESVGKWMENENTKLQKESQLKKIKVLSLKNTDAAILKFSELFDVGLGGANYKDNIMAVFIKDKTLLKINPRLFRETTDEEVEKMMESLMFGEL